MKIFGDAILDYYIGTISLILLIVNIVILYAIKPEKLIYIPSEDFYF